MFRNTSYFILTTIICLSSVSYAEEEKIDINGSQPIKAGVRHIEKGGVGYTNGYTTLEMFLSSPYDSWSVVPFVDLRGHVFNDGKFAANAGFGIRGLAGCRVYGMNAYYDYRNTKHQHYNQIAVGLESLGIRWDFRINGYLPIGSKTSANYDTLTDITPGTFDSFSGNYALLRQTKTKSWKTEYAMKGLDSEAAFHFLKNKNFDLYAAVGPYYYTYGNKQAIGGKIRLATQIYQCLSLELINSYDSRFHENFQGQVGFSIPFGPKKKIAKNQKLQNCNDSYLLSQRLVQDVKRQEIIVVDKFSKKEVNDLVSIAIDPRTNSPYYFVFVDNTSNSLGTFSSPYPTFAQAEANSNPGDIIYVFPGDGTTTGMDAGITLKADQKLWGSVTPYTIATTEGAITIPQMSNTRPQITNLETEGVGITLATNNDIRGLEIVSTSGEAILGVDPESFSLSSCYITECGQAGMGITPVLIQASSPFSGVFDSNILSHNLNGGIYIELQPGSSSSTCIVTNNIATDNEATTGGAAIFNVDPNGEIGSCTLYVAGNSFTDNSALSSINIQNILGGGAGSFSSFTGNFSSNTFSDNSLGISYIANANSCTLSITDSDLSNNENGSVIVTAGDDRITDVVLTIDGNQINGSFGSGANALNISPVCDRFTCSIVNNSISDNNSSGILYYNEHTPLPDLIFTISNNTISHNLNEAANAAGGVSIDGFNSLHLTMSGNEFSNNTNGLVIGGYGSSVPYPLGDAIITFNDNTLTEGDTFSFQFWGADPATGCLSIAGDSSSESIGYYFYQQNTGPCKIAPVAYETDNIGGFSLSGDITSVSSCSEE